MPHVEDTRVDICLYLVAPSSFKDQDLVAMRRLSKHVPVIPLIGKVRVPGCTSGSTNCTDLVQAAWRCWQALKTHSLCMFSLHYFWRLRSCKPAKDTVAIGAGQQEIASCKGCALFGPTAPFSCGMQSLMAPFSVVCNPKHRSVDAG